MELPDGFMWGTGASSAQCEGAAPESDWIDREWNVRPSAAVLQREAHS